MDSEIVFNILKRTWVVTTLSWSGENKFLSMEQSTCTYISEQEKENIKYTLNTKKEQRLL
jgi:hypothetical protein